MPNDQCGAGAATRAPTVTSTDISTAEAARKYLGVLFCTHKSEEHEGVAIGLNDNNEFNSVAKGRYTTEYARRLALAFCHDNLQDAREREATPSTAASQPPAEDETVPQHAADLYPKDTRVEVYWPLYKNWYAATVLETRVRAHKVKAHEPSVKCREIFADYDDGWQQWHSLHNNSVRRITTAFEDLGTTMIALYLSDEEAIKDKVCAIPPGSTFIVPRMLIDVQTGDITEYKTAFVMASDQLIEVNISEHDTKGAHRWHVPRNEREYLRSPQKALWRTARELKMDEYRELNMFKVIPVSEVDTSKYTIHDLLWAGNIKFDKHLTFEKLNPRLCFKGGSMDRSIYRAFAEASPMWGFNGASALKAAYFKLLVIFELDLKNAFQATRQDRPGMNHPPLYSRQAPGFVEYGPNGEAMCWQILVGMQGRIDATNLFEHDKDVLLFTSNWIPMKSQKKSYIYHNSPLVNTTASLLEKLIYCHEHQGDTGPDGLPVG